MFKGKDDCNHIVMHTINGPKADYFNYSRLPDNRFQFFNIIPELFKLIDVLQINQSFLM
jgi:hypothetical protein